MTAHRTLLTGLFCFAMLCPVLLPLSRGQDVAPDVANGKRALVCKINANAVYVHSGPGDSYYPTMKLDADKEVTVVGEKFEWLKIMPPEGSFSYIARAFVDKNPDGSGTVSKDEVNVRCGSSLNAMKTSIQAKLEKGQRVQITDEKDEYFVIKPPDGAYLYINKKFVTPVRYADMPIAQAPAAPKAEPAVPTPDQAIAGATTRESQIATVDDASRTGPRAGDGPTTAPTREQTAAAPAPAATQPTAEVEFDKLEVEFADASNKNIEQQPIADLLERYKKSLADGTLPESMKRIADFRVRTLTARNEAKAQFAAVQKMQAESKEKQTALKAEQEELAQQIKKNEVVMYAAVGTLRTSSFQQGQTTLYRLTDPQTGRTVVYIRTNDAKYATLIGKFVGVKGDVATEQQLSMKVVTPSDVAEVEQAQVFKSVAAQIVPPSLLPQGAEQAASTGNQ